MRGWVDGRVALGLRAENHTWRGYRARMVFLQISLGPEGTGSKDSLILVAWMAGVWAGVPDWRWTSCSPEPLDAQFLACPVPRPLPHHTQEKGVLAPGRHT